MRSERILLFDDEFNIFIWCGKTATDRKELILEQTMTFINDLVSKRFPRSGVITFNEGDSMSRFLFSRLSPSHKVIFFFFFSS